MDYVQHYMLRFGILAAVVMQAVAQDAIKVDVHLVNVTFSVRDSRGTPVGELTRDDFEILEDNVLQKVSFFGRQNDLPISLGLLIDASGSQEHFGKQHHHDLQEFLKNTLQPRDRAFLMCFGNHLRLTSDYSSSPAHILGALQLFEKGDHSTPELGPKEYREQGTAFYDSIYYSINEKLASADQGRRALVMFSDGEDNSSAHNLLDAIETAQSADVLFFALRYTDVRKGQLTARNKYGISVMERLASMTGGAHFDAREKGLPAAFKDITEQLRSSYEIGYYSSNALRDGGFRKITIRVQQHVQQEGLTVRAKTGYYAR
jgi:Ca-activated chloride channel family protein